MKALIAEFKDFALKGNLVEIAVGLVLALAFTTVVNSLVDGIVLPIVTMLFGQPSFDGLTFTINDSIFYYGAFISAAVTFLLTALALFLFVVKPYNALRARRARGEEPESEPSEEIALLREIRDSLRAR